MTQVGDVHITIAVRLVLRAVKVMRSSDHPAALNRGIGGVARSHDNVATKAS